MKDLENHLLMAQVIPDEHPQATQSPFDWSWVVREVIVEARLGQRQGG